MASMTAKQQTLVKARKAARIVASLLIFGGAVIFVLGLATLALPEVMDGVVLMVCSAPMFVVAKYCEKKLDQPSV